VPEGDRLRAVNVLFWRPLVAWPRVVVYMVVVNRLLWRRLYRLAESRYSL